jgi:exosortase/archaeosortase family protein
MTTTVSAPQPRAATGLLDRIDVQRHARPLLALAIIVVAYHTSISTLIEGLSLDTPLAHLALVPAISLLLAVIHGKPKATEPPIHDRQLDWILGLPLVVAALAMNLLLPARLSTMFWVWRVDLLSFPFFVAGVVSLLFGVRTLWRIRAAILFLFLAWPWPYNQVLDRWLGEFTELTIAGLKFVLQFWHIASPATTGDGSLFDIPHGAESVRLSVASACSGANGVVGFFLVGTAFLLVVEGNKWRKVAWLALGAAVVWVLNLVRILVIFLAAHKWGERVAIDGFHPFIGLVVFNVAVLLMLLLIRPFGLRLRTAPSPRALAARPTPHRPRAHTAFCSVLVITLALGVLNADLRSNDPVATSLGSPRLAGFATTRETPAGWSLIEQERIDWARRFYGRDSNWVRYVYRDGSGGIAAEGEAGAQALHSSIPIYADIIDTSSRNGLSAYGVESCYKFHGYRVSKKHSVDLGSGVVGGMLSWTNPDNDTTWTSLWWHWPIKTENGTRYERVTLLINDSPTASLAAPEPSRDRTSGLGVDLTDAIQGGDGDDGIGSERLAETRKFLISFGQELVRKRIATA